VADNLLGMLLNSRIVLQDFQTGRYMRADLIWTTNINEACGFTSVFQATLFGMKQLTDPYHIVEIEANNLQIPTSSLNEKQQLSV